MIFANHGEITALSVLAFFALGGLNLLRRVTYKPTALGSLADQTDFEDYRTVEGVKFPFLVNAATGALATARTYTEIEFNVPLDDARFSTAERCAGPIGEMTVGASKRHGGRCL